MLSRLRAPVGRAPRSRGLSYRVLAPFALVALAAVVAAGCGGEAGTSTNTVSGWMQPNGSCADTRVADSQIDSGNVDELNLKRSQPLTGAGLNRLDLGDPMETLDPRESRWSLAGVSLAAVVEEIADHGDAYTALPPADDALVSGTRTPVTGGGWAFVRAGESFPGNHPNYAHLHDRSATGVLWNPDDAKAPNGIDSSREAQFGAGIWLVPYPNETPDEFARRTADAIDRYRPDKVVLDIEAIGKGYAGSVGWRWSDEMMDAFARLQPEPPPLAVTVEPLQDDFNYVAYTSRGAEVWPQAYLGDMTPRDPREVVERVVANGVPRELVVPVLGPGQLDDYEGPRNLYTADDAQGSPSA